VTVSVAMVLGLSACNSAPSDDTPTGALQLFVAAMDRSEWDDNALRDAYALLSPAARDALRVRAEEAGSLSGREFDPWQMLAQGRFRLRFAPRPGDGMEERVEGERAVVVVSGSRPDHRAEVPMLLENGRWRVDLVLPPSHTPGVE